MIKYAAVPALALAAPNAAEAAFVGTYAPVNWTLTTNGGDGSVNTAGAPASIDLLGSDINGVVNTDYTIAVTGSGTWSFSWSFDNQDTTTGYDFGGYLLNGVYTGLAGASASGGPESIAVNAGDVIGFRVNCDSCGFGRGILTIRDFSAPEAGSNSAPEPSSLALMALGAGGVMAARRRKASR